MRNSKIEILAGANKEREREIKIKRTKESGKREGTAVGVVAMNVR